MVAIYTFPKEARIRKKREYRHVRARGSRSVGDLLILDSAPSRHEGIRLGLIVSKKFGKAHERNRFKRQVRESFRQMRPTLSGSRLVTVSPRSSAQGATMQAISAELQRLLMAPRA